MNCLFLHTHTCLNSCCRDDGICRGVCLCHYESNIIGRLCILFFLCYVEILRAESNESNRSNVVSPTKQPSCQVRWILCCITCCTWCHRLLVMSKAYSSDISDTSFKLPCLCPETVILSPMKDHWMVVSTSLINSLLLWQKLEELEIETAELLEFCICLYFKLQNYGLPIVDGC